MNKKDETYIDQIRELLNQNGIENEDELSDFQRSNEDIKKATESLKIILKIKTKGDNNKTSTMVIGSNSGTINNTKKWYSTLIFNFNWFF